MDSALSGPPPYQIALDFMSKYSEVEIEEIDPRGEVAFEELLSSTKRRKLLDARRKGPYVVRPLQVAADHVVYPPACPPSAPIPLTMRPAKVVHCQLKVFKVKDEEDGSDVECLGVVTPPVVTSAAASDSENGPATPGPSGLPQGLPASPPEVLPASPQEALAAQAPPAAEPVITAPQVEQAVEPKARPARRMTGKQVPK